MIKWQQTYTCYCDSPFCGTVLLIINDRSWDIGFPYYALYQNGWYMFLKSGQCECSIPWIICDECIEDFEGEIE